MTNGKCSVLYSERRVGSRRIQIDFFKVFHSREAGARGEFMLEALDTLMWPFSHCFYSSIIKVFYVADDLMARGGALSKKSEPDALHFPAKNKFARNCFGHVLQAHDYSLFPFGRGSFPKRVGFSI